MHIPSGKQLIIAVFLASTALVALYTTGTLPWLIFAAVFGVVLYLMYALAVRFHEVLTNPDHSLLPGGGDNG